MNVKTLKKMLETVDEELIVCFLNEATEFPIEIDTITAPATETYYTVGDEIVNDGKVMLLGR